MTRAHGTLLWLYGACKNKMVIIYWTCGGVAKVAIIVIVRSQMDQTNHLAASRKFDFPEI